MQAAAGTRLVLNNGGSATYTSGNGSNNLIFTYIPQQGQGSADLGMASSGALLGSIVNDAGDAAAADLLDGINPPGVLVVDGVRITLGYAVGRDGLQVLTNKPAEILLEDGAGLRSFLFADHLDPVDVVIAARAMGTTTGTLVAVAPSGDTVSDPDGTVIALGSNANDTLGGQLAWGFDGDDLIDGTAGADTLYGGAGNDTIRAGLGADIVFGGAGGDSIDLGDDNAVDRVVYAAGDVNPGEPLFQDGDPTTSIDKLVNARVGDIIDMGRAFGGAPVLRPTYLNGLNPNEMALVRGSDAGGVFVQGSSAQDNDFMLQWVTNGVVFSTILHDYGSRAEFVVDRNAGTLTLLALTQTPSPVSSVSPALIGAPSTLTINTALDPITHVAGSPTGLADPNGFGFWDLRGGTLQPTAIDYTDGPLFGLHQNILSFDATLASGLYSMTWTSATFATTGGHATGGQAYFAGGFNHGFDNGGFSLARVETPPGDVSYTDAVQRAIFGPAFGAATFMTGRGNDVVLSQAAPLTIVYASIDADAEDLILDFDPAKDAIGLSDELRAAVDDDGNGLDWMGGGGGQLVINGSVEAVELTLNDPAASVSSVASLAPQTLDTLNDGLDVRQLARGDDLLILARHSLYTGSAALLYYRAEDDNGVIDANEITFIATFNGGAPSLSDIILVGVPAP